MSQTPIADVPFPVQIITESNALGAAGSSVAKALTGSPGVTLTNQTDSPSQSDIRLRGFALSPIVGVPQGVSVFVDRIELIRGSVGVFGRNSLAGALNIVTRRGRERSVEMEIEGGFYGSFGRTDRRVALLYVRVPLPGGCGTAARVLADFRQSNDNITEPDALGLTDIRTLGSTA